MSIGGVHGVQADMREREREMEKERWRVKEFNDFLSFLEENLMT